MSGKDSLTLVTEPGKETSKGHNEEWYEFSSVVDGFDFSHLGKHLSPGEAVGENARVLSGDTADTGTILTIAGGIVSCSISAALSGVSITVKVKILDLGDESVNVIKV
jgi:hypothetical protein